MNTYIYYLNRSRVSFNQHIIQITAALIIRVSIARYIVRNNKTVRLKRKKKKEGGKGRQNDRFLIEI